MSEYYHIDWNFSDNTLIDIDLLNVIMSYGDPCINQQFTCVLKQLEYLSKEFDYLRNVKRSIRRLCSKRFYRYCLSKNRQKKRLMKRKLVTPPPSPVSVVPERKTKILS